MDQFQTFIHKSKYARWLPEEGRRETWEETVNRYTGFMQKKAGFDDDVYLELFAAIRNMEVMPSMRSLMTAGKALERDNVSGYNCSYVAIDHVRAFDETMYVLMCGSGVGFSVERQYVSKLPTVPEVFEDSSKIITIRDSKIGWCSSFRSLLSELFNGKIPKWDSSRVRAAGMPLKTFGGRASGPEPLESLFDFTIETFQRAKGRRLSSLEVHDLVCKIADIVVVGGVRRSALISLSNLSDDRLRGAKSGQWWEHNPQRALANNSAVYDSKPEFDVFLKEWCSLYESKSGERGIFSRVAAEKKAAENGRRVYYVGLGVNPCGEILLRSCQFCNLSEVVVRPSDTIEDLKRKVKQATILGTLQSSLTDFRYLRKIWSDNTKEERLLGVSLTGIMDHPVMGGKASTIEVLPKLLEELKNVAIETNKEWADILGIPASVAVTCVKPSGTVSQLVDSASGIHSRHSPYYIRTVRADIKDPLTQLMIDQGAPNEPCVMKPDSTVIFSFPIKSPEGAHVVADDTAMEQLKLWKIYQEHWCEHNPSVTVYYRDEEFLDVGSWVYNNIDVVTGVSFLPRDDHTYKQAPYQKCTEEEHEALKAVMPEIDWSKLGEYETEDRTSGSQTLACTGGSCEMVDLT